MTEDYLEDDYDDYEAYEEQEDEEIKIIIIDDSDLSRKGIVEALEAEGFNVTGEADSATAGFQLANTDPADIYIIDVVMPEISGIELAKKITELPKESRIIMISSLAMESVIIESISNGAADFIQKPFTRETLVDSVRKVHSLIQGERG